MPSCMKVNPVLSLLIEESLLELVSSERALRGRAGGESQQDGTLGGPVPLIRPRMLSQHLSRVSFRLMSSSNG
jgi:hypothetical protein